MKKTLGSTLIVTLLTLFAVPAAWANCITGGQKNSRSPIEALRHPGVLGSSSQAAVDGSSASIVGMWTVTFLVGNGPDVYDVGLEQWHADGTEVTLDVAVPPAAGNICLGVWERVGPRAYKLHHLGWNWDTSVTPAAFAGVFVLDMTVALSVDGRTYVGKYITDSYDTEGNVIPAFHGEGVVSGRRIEVH
jgi:hypothetical protein